MHTSLNLGWAKCPRTRVEEATPTGRDVCRTVAVANSRRRNRTSPGQLLGSVSGELGLRSFLEGAGHTFVVTSDKDRADSVFDRELVDADIVISQPFWPAYLTAERVAKARNLKLAITAGIGSDHVDLQAAID